MTEAIIRIGDEEIHTLERAKDLGVVFGRNCNSPNLEEGNRNKKKRGQLEETTEKKGKKS